jgi:arginase
LAKPKFTGVLIWLPGRRLYFRLEGKGLWFVASHLLSPSIMSTKLALIVSPFHVGIHQHRVGKGPERILASLTPRLDAESIAYRIETLEKVDEFEGEIGRSFALLRRIAEETSKAVRAGEFPVILAGNCHSTAAVVAGLTAAGTPLKDLDVFWTDAHADAQIPDDNTNGYFDSMGTSMIAGLCWKHHMSTLVKHVPHSLDHITYIGIRDLETSERARIIDGGAHCIFGGKDGIDYAAALRDRLQSQAPEKQSVVHIDLDSLDPKVGHANDYPVPGGLLAHDLLGVLDALASCRPTSLTVASFDPDLENGARIVDLAVQGIVNFVKEKQKTSQKQ